MLRALSIRNFVVVEALDVEFDRGFSVLTGETGAGKSILLDALSLLLGDRFELRQLRPGAERAELAAEFEVADAPGVSAWLGEHDYVTAGGDVLLRRVLDAQGKSRAWINGRPATLAQLTELGERLVDLHGQNTHQTLATAEAQRVLLDAFGGFATLTRETGEAWRAWRAASDAHAAAAGAAQANAAEREVLDQRRRELAAANVAPGEWERLATTQTRLAHAAALIAAAAQGEETLAGDDSLALRIAQLAQRLDAAATHDPALAEIAAQLEPARIQLDEAARALRDYRERLDVDPRELATVEERLAELHDLARKHRVRPEALAELLAETEARHAALEESADAAALAARVAKAERRYRALADTLSSKRRYAATELAHRVSAAMQELAMAGGRLEVALTPLATPASHGQEQVEFQVASHPKQPLGPLGRVASGGELSRIALAIQVVTSEVGQVPTLVFDEVDTGIGGAVAATVGRQLQALGARRQVLCVTHLPQVAACADAHFRVTKRGDGEQVTSELERLAKDARLAEVARMLGGAAITAKTRAHAKELLELHRRPGK
jgi:DNA repair protein RecN (Recombination protein N)